MTGASDILLLQPCIKACETRIPRQEIDSRLMNKLNGGRKFKLTVFDFNQALRNMHNILTNAFICYIFVSRDAVLSLRKGRDCTV